MIVVGLLALSILALSVTVFRRDSSAIPPPISPVADAGGADGSSSRPESQPLDAPRSAPHEAVTQRAAELGAAATNLAPVAPRDMTIVVRARLASGGSPAHWTLEVDDVARVTRDSSAARERHEVDGAEIRLARPVGSLTRVCALARGLASRSVGVTAVARVDETVVELTLEPAPSVRGEIADERGTPAAGIAVWLRPTFDPARTTEMALDLASTTDASGQFDFPSVPSGSWVLVAGDRAAPVAHRAGVVVERADLVLEPLKLPPLFEIVVRAVDDGGVPVAGARVWARGTNGGRLETTTDAYGEARGGSLPAGRYRVYVDSPVGRANVNTILPLDPSAPALTVRLRARR